MGWPVKHLWAKAITWYVWRFRAAQPGRHWGDW